MYRLLVLLPTNHVTVGSTVRLIQQFQRPALGSCDNIQGYYCVDMLHHLKDLVVICPLLGEPVQI